MRISDWSSDVCSSDLAVAVAADPHRAGRRALTIAARSRPARGRVAAAVCRCPSHHLAMPDWRAARSEEHTSELQSLMRTSYAVFCLKKKKQYVTATWYPNTSVTLCVYHASPNSNRTMTIH